MGNPCPSKNTVVSFRRGLQEAQQALVAADGLSRDSGDGASTPQGVEPAEPPEPSVEAVPGKVKEDTEKPEGPELTADP